MTMTPEAKAQLGTTIRAIRQHLVGLPTQPDDGALHAATETAYRLSVRTQDAGLDEAARVRRARLEAWIGEQQRADAGQGSKGGKKPRAAEDYRGEAEKQAAYTLLNRLVLLRLMEAPGPGGAPLRAPAVVTGGWESRAYQDFRQLAPALCKNTRGNESEGYAFLLQLVFEDLATDLPGLYGPAGVAELIPIPAATLRHVVDALNDPALDSCWSDDMTLGWVYQYWNDPEREALDAKLNGGGKVEPHELASKTQMFTERYMVDWLLQNSLNPLWLAICAKNGWTADVSSRTSPPDPLSLTGEGEYGGSGPGFAGERGSVLWGLEERRVAWRAQREEGTVGLTELMPLYSELERRWAYYVPQPIPDEAVAHAPDSVRDLKLLDPAVGSGHFLVVAFDLLLAFYQEEARHRASSPLSQGGEGGRGGEVSLRHAVESILENNLHGLDLDPRAIQIAAAALWLKAKQVAPDARPERLNLVAANLRLASLPDDDPALVELRHKVERQTGIPGALTDTIVHALRGADHLGSLLKIDQAVEAALDQHERRPELQTELFGPPIIEEDEWAFAKPPRFRVVDSPFITPEKLALAKRFRKEPTDAEAKAWALLRNRQIHNLKFRRQQPILGFIVDFYCAEHGIILELDGPIHDSQQDYDQARTEILQSTGMWVLRLRNEDVTPEHLSALLQAFGPHPPQPPLSPEGEGGGTGSPPLRSR